MSEPMHPLRADWIGNRDNSTYIHKRVSNRTGWEARTGKAYSEHILGKGKIKSMDLLKTAYRLCSNRLRGLQPARPITLRLDPRKNCTNGQWVIISTEVVDEPTLSAHEKIDVMLGATTHEAAHLLYTDFAPHYIKSSFQKTILNILEDERIEILIGENFPGYAAYLEKIKNYYFDFKHSKKDFSSPAEEVFEIFFEAIRYPRFLTDERVAKHEVILGEIKDVITPYPDTFKKTFEASVKIAELFEKHFSELPTSEDEEGKGGAPSDQEGEGAEMTGKEAAKKIMEAIAGKMKDLESGLENPAAVKPAKVIMRDENAEAIITGAISFNKDSKTYFVKGIDNKKNYQTERNSLISQARLLARNLVLQTREDVSIIRGLREGSFDSRKIIEAAFGMDTVYKQDRTRKAAQISLVLLIDESGSMGMKSGTNKKIKEAQRVAILFAEAARLSGQACDFYIYGFTADEDQYGRGTNTITLYREKGLDRTHALGSVSEKSNNRDGVAMLEVAKRVRSFTDKKCLFIVISDGQPSASDYPDAVEHTAMAVRELSKDGFLPIQVGIAVNESDQKKMFTHYINYKDAKTLVSSMAGVLKKEVTRFLAAK